MHTRVRADTLVCVRVTVDLPDALVTEAMAHARAEGRTSASLVAEGLRRVLSRPPERPEPVEPLPAHGDAGGGFLVDISDRDALEAALDTDGPR